MLISTPRAPWIETSSSSGLEIAFWAASTGAVLAARDGGAHQRHAHLGHDRADVVEVEVDEAVDGDEVGRCRARPGAARRRPS
jgi:hypothetical protein